MAWSINEIKNEYCFVEGAFAITYSISGIPTIKKHEISVDDGVTFNEITPVGNLTGFSVNVDMKVGDVKTCYIRCTDSEGFSKTSNGFTLTFGNAEENKPPVIRNIKVIMSNSSGNYQINYEVIHKTIAHFKHLLIIDDEEILIEPIRSENTYAYAGRGLSGGTHLCKIRAFTPTCTAESQVFQIIIPNLENNPPTISDITVEEATYKGRYKLSYTVNDIDKTDLITHKIKFDTGEYMTIKPISIDNKYIYNGTGLSEGSHEGIISVSDGKAIVNSKPFNVTIGTQDGIGLKQKLAKAKTDYDLSYSSLINTVKKVIEDMKTVINYDSAEGALLVETAYKDYADKSVILKDFTQQAIDLISSNKTDTAKEDLAKEIGDLTNSLGSLDASMNDIFKDGILTEAEKLVIRQNLQSLSLEKVDVDNQYNSILSKFNKSDLEYAESGRLDHIQVGDSFEKYPDKKWYLTIYNDFKNAYKIYGEKYDNLMLTIDYILRKDGIIDNTDKEKKDKAFNEYTLAIGEYSKHASSAIEAIGRNETENNETLVQVFKGEYIRTNKENSSKLSALTQTTNGLEERVSQFYQTADEIRTEVKRNTNNITTQASIISQLSDEILLKVDKGSFGSLIRQNANSIVMGLNNYSNRGTWITLRDGYVTFENCYVSCRAITCLPGESPYLSLFGDTSPGKCAIDATAIYNWGIGDAIRLKWDNSNYILIAENNFSFYTYDYGENAMFKVTDSGMYYKGTKILSYDANGKHFNGYQVNVNAINDNGRGSILLRTSIDGHNKNLGYSESKFNQVVATNLYGKCNGSSDIRLKENIHYLSDNQTISNTDDRLLVENAITNDDLYGFVKNELKLSTYNYNEKYYGDLYNPEQAETELGFIAQDVVGTKVEDLIIRKDDSNNLVYSLNGYVSVLAGALQKAINKIETLETEVNNLKNGGKK